MGSHNKPTSKIKAAGDGIMPVWEAALFAERAWNVECGIRPSTAPAQHPAQHQEKEPSWVYLRPPGPWHLGPL